MAARHGGAGATSAKNGRNNKAKQAGATCWLCGGTGHRKSACPKMNSSKVCFGCRKRGHVLADCPQAAARCPPATDDGGGADTKVKAAASGGVVCYNCGGRGHIASTTLEPSRVLPCLRGRPGAASR